MFQISIRSKITRIFIAKIDGNYIAVYNLLSSVYHVRFVSAALTPFIPVYTLAMLHQKKEYFSPNHPYDCCVKSLIVHIWYSPPLCLHSFDRDATTPNKATFFTFSCSPDFNFAHGQRKSHANGTLQAGRGNLMMCCIRKSVGQVISASVLMK